MRHHRSSDWESLESRALLVGFYDGPAPVPIQVALRGAVLGTAAARPATGATYNVSAVGSLAPLGRAAIRGTIRVAGGVERGTLTLDAATTHLTIRFAGAIPAGPAPTYGAFAFQVVDGRASVPNTTFSQASVQGGGTVQTLIAPGPAPGRAAVALVFSNS